MSSAIRAIEPRFDAEHDVNQWYSDYCTLPPYYSHLEIHILG